jgi:hypothetical protein
MTDYPTNDEAQRASSGVIRDRNISGEKLLKIYETFGGVAVFKKAKLSEGYAYLRQALVTADNFPEKQFLELFNALEKLNKGNVSSFAEHPVVISNPTVFQSLWEVDPNGTFQGISSFLLGEQVYHKEWGGAWETLDQVHGDRCGAHRDNPHYWCYTPRVIHGDKLVEFFKKFQIEVLAKMDPAILKTIHTEIMSLNERSKVDYAESVLIADDHWQLLANDKRPVLNALATNSLLPEPLAYDIIASHKTPALRQSIAKSTGSGELLEYIWNGTSSKAIHKAVAENSVSCRYLSHPECLEPYYDLR